MTAPLPPDEPRTFPEVFEEELTQVAARRGIQYERAEATADPRQSLAGLALSGGGIRSATFSLGVLQALDQLGVLRLFDYLSTVSGGGFVGGWWSAYLSRSPAPGRLFPPPEKIEPQRAGDYLKPRVAEGALAAGDDPIHHLRLFSNYLTPRKGLMSGDTWRAVAVVTRNLVLTWLVLLPILFCAVLAGQLYFVFQPFSDEVVRVFTHYSVDGNENGGAHHGPSPHEDLGDRARVAARPLLAIAFLWALVTVLWMRFNNDGLGITHRVALGAIVVSLLAIPAVYNPDLWTWIGKDSGGGGERSALALLWPWTWDLLLVLLTVGVAVWLVRWILRLPPNVQAGTPGQRKQLLSVRATAVHAKLLVVFVLAFGVLLFAGFAHELVELIVWDPDAIKRTGSVLTVLGTLASAIYTALKAAPRGGGDPRAVARPGLASRVVFALAPPLVLLLLATLAASLAHVLVTAVLARGWDRIVPLLLVVLAGIALCLVFAAYETRIAEERRDGLLRLASGFVVSGTVGFAVLLGSFLLPEPAAFRAEVTGGKVAYFAAYTAAFLVGVLACVVMLVDLFRPGRSNRRACFLLGFVVLVMLAVLVSVHPWVDAYWKSTAESSVEDFFGVAANERSQPLLASVLLLAAAGFWVIALGWMADPNALSLHTFYKSRLVRAYLGASNPLRKIQKKEITDTADGDDLELKQVATCARGGPYHLVNTTLNLVAGGDLATAQRSAAVFVLSPLACGSLRTGYRKTEEYMTGRLSLGAAVAASGAAVSPTMGSSTPSAALAMLLAFVNVRLGFWAPTPHKLYWRSPQSRLWPYYLLREMLSQTNDLQSYCYLTDGGHFDNTGLYSLIERGCRFIVLVDNGADPDPNFEDLGIAIRRCRIDFDAEITLDVTGFRKTGGAPVAQHYAVGSIVYAEDQLASLGWVRRTPADRTGTIVWIKPALAADETADVRQYGFQNPVFPQQTTADQWFDEAQFESYRKLGELSALRVFPPLAAGPLTRPAVDAAFPRRPGP